MMIEQVSTLSVHNIGVVERRTGIKADLVRAWERRYGAVVPSRTATDRRLYSDADIERLMKLRDATRLGHRISHIATLSDEELSRLFPSPVRTFQPGVTSEAENEIESKQALCMSSILSLDGPRLASLLENASLDLGRVAFVESFLVPLLDRVGTGWIHGELDISHEHLATATIRTFTSRFVGMPSPSDAPSIVVTTPAGQLHELGASLAASMAAAQGWRVVYLGPNTPADSIARAARQSGARVVAIGVTFHEAILEAEIESLAGQLGSVQLVIGGRGASSLETLAHRLDLTIVRDLTSLRAFLASLTSKGESS